MHSLAFIGIHRSQSQILQTLNASDSAKVILHPVEPLLAIFRFPSGNQEFLDFYDQEDGNAAGEWNQPMTELEGCGAEDGVHKRNVNKDEL